MCKVAAYPPVVERRVHGDSGAEYGSRRLQREPLRDLHQVPEQYILHANSILGSYSIGYVLQIQVFRSLQLTPTPLPLPVLE